MWFYEKNQTEAVQQDFEAESADRVTYIISHDRECRAYPSPPAHKPFLPRRQHVDMSELAQALPEYLVPSDPAFPAMDTARKVPFRSIYGL